MRLPLMLGAAVMALAAAGVAHVQASDPPQAATPRCFGAASRDPLRPCQNPSLRLVVAPTPAEARNLPNAPCGLTLQGALPVCAFGVAAEVSSGTIALIGDSHAAHWRAAIEVVAQSHGWYGLSMTHSSCPFSRATRNLPGTARRRCAQWRHRVLSWFGRHPEVRTVFVAGLSGGSGVIPRGGRDEFATAVAGYVDAWRALPASVRHIVVLRDTPKMRWDNNRCVQGAMASHQRPGRTCAVPRSVALERDPLVAAAARLHSRRVRVVDLTRVFCDRRPCYPVIGGALVYKDSHHLTRVFAATLGPLVLRTLG